MFAALIAESESVAGEVPCGAALELLDDFCAELLVCEEPDLGLCCSRCRLGSHGVEFVSCGPVVNDGNLLLWTSCGGFLIQSNFEVGLELPHLVADLVSKFSRQAHQ
jgi:hypothetical protein